jgi:hypothetical protein
MSYRLLLCYGLVLVEDITGRIVLAGSHIVEYLSEGVRRQGLVQSNRAKDCAHQHPERDNFGDNRRIGTPGSRRAKQDFTRPLCRKSSTSLCCRFELYFLAWSKAACDASRPAGSAFGASETAFDSEIALVVNGFHIVSFLAITGGIIEIPSVIAGALNRLLCARCHP